MLMALLAEENYVEEKKKKDNSGFWKQAYVSNCMGTGLRIVYDKFCQKYA